MSQHIILNRGWWMSQIFTSPSYILWNIVDIISKYLQQIHRFWWCSTPANINPGPGTADWDPRDLTSSCPRPLDMNWWMAPRLAPLIPARFMRWRAREKAQWGGEAPESHMKKKGVYTHVLVRLGLEVVLQYLMLVNSEQGWTLRISDIEWLYMRLYMQRHGKTLISDNVVVLAGLMTPWVNRTKTNSFYV
jgi:hypothetical protein